MKRNVFPFMQIHSRKNDVEMAFNKQQLRAALNYYNFAIVLEFEGFDTVSNFVTRWVNFRETHLHEYKLH